jgi:hypothetical protein
MAAAAAAAIQLETAQGQHYFRVPGGAEGAVAVFVAGSELPMLGTQASAGADLVFTPRFGLQPGVTYRVEFRGREPATATFQLEPPRTGAASVEQVYPSAAELPENQLKLYLHFATPMARGEIYRHVHLLDAQGRQIEQPFLELGEELWDRQLRRFTLLFDPGRVKRDLVPNREVGAPLVAGRSYTLLIDAKLRDAAGRALQAEYRKRFTVRAADRSSPDPQQWRVLAPARSSRVALVLTFPEPLDHGLLQRCISVQDASGAVIAGEVKVDRDEQRWQFEPRAVWQEGEYRIRIDPALEDLAGNRIGRLFDADIIEGESRESADGSQELGVGRREQDKNQASLRFVVEQ